MKLTIALLSVLLLSLCFLNAIHSQSLDWINQIPKGGAMFVRPTFIRSDAANNVYVAKLETTTSPGGTSASAQILKFNSAGALQWNITLPGASNPLGWFDTASDGSVFVTGSGLPFSTGVFAGFVQKYNTNGVFQWQKLYPNANLGRAIPLSGGRVRVEVAETSLVPNPARFAETFDANGVSLSVEPLLNVIVSTSPFDPVAASKSNSVGDYCGVLPSPFQFARFNSAGGIIWSQPVTGVFFPFLVSQILIDESGNCVFTGLGSNMTVGPVSVPPVELRSDFLTLINSAGVPQFIRIYDFQSLDGLDCGALPTSFLRCWISGRDLDGRPALARLDPNFNIVDLFVGEGVNTTLTFKIAFTPSRKLAGAFSTGIASGSWFGAPIVVPPDPSNFFTGALFVFQLNLATTNCNRTLSCAAGNNCCLLSNGDTACYNPSVYSCFTQFGKLCPFNTLPCGNACYSLSAFSCSNGSLCPVGTLQCGPACYNPFVHSCFANNVLCPVGTVPCGNACVASGSTCP